MTKENHTCDNVNCNHNDTKGLCCLHNPDNCKYRQLQKQIADLEEKISILLSCKNCPENKGGLICQKEYENKCLAQKIEFIKELQKKNAELKATYKKQRNKRIDELQKENAELKKEKEEIEIMTNFCKACKKMHTDNLAKAKEILRLFLDANDNLEMINAQRKAEQFLNSEVEK